MGLTNADVETLEEARHQAREWGPAEPMRFE
jgi:hypothetical protein